MYAPNWAIPAFRTRIWCIFAPNWAIPTIGPQIWCIFALHLDLFRQVGVNLVHFCTKLGDSGVWRMNLVHFCTRLGDTGAVTNQ
jgi:hypothetical protein